MNVNVRGQKEAVKLLDSLSDRELQNRVRRGTRAGAKVFREETRRQAKARGDIPNSFAKTATRGHRTPVGTSTGPTSPLLNIFEPGAKVHGVGMGAPNSRGTKRFLSNVGARAGFVGPAVDAFFARAPVRHPGMDARPLIGPIFEQKEAEATEAAIDTFLEGLD